jgi:Flp pilus assembly protein TadG
MEVHQCVLVLLACGMLEACGGSGNTCTITTDITPSSATADHTMGAPGDQAQFSLTSSVKGNCPLVADSVGVWSTSDPVNTIISNQAPNQGLATCVNATSTSVTIRNSGTVRGHAYPSAKLTCK